MSNPFFDQPILNSPYARPTRHWELDGSGQPTQIIKESRRQPSCPEACHGRGQDHGHGQAQARRAWGGAGGAGDQFQDFDRLKVRT